MKFTTRLSHLVVAALIFAACGSSSETASTPSDSGVSDTVDAVETEQAEEAPEAVEASDDPAPEITTTSAPASPEPVTASTVHETTSDDFPDIIAAQATPDGDGTWRFDVTVSSTYDSAARYADAWRVVGPDGTEFGIRVLTHDHASEQPFTRSQSGISIPANVTTVTVEGRDQANGWGGGVLEVALN